jgi:uncharacterized protein YhhL (DUF1145 family)
MNDCALMLAKGMAQAICVWMTALINLTKSGHGPSITVIQITVRLLIKDHNIVQILEDTLQNIVKS